jgi:two-component system, OmpR family, alkaline phosphatase synthesis response regulator PhoP
MSEATPQVLVVDDDYQVAELLSAHLTEAGFQVTHAADGIRATELALGNSYDLIILDVMLPGKRGTEICRELRSKKCSSRIMMLTLRGDELDRVLGLELGADDYVTKPFSAREVVARARAILRRNDADDRGGVAAIAIGSVAIDLEKRKVQIAGKEIELTATEFDLLAFLGTNPGRAYSREQLLTSVWGYTSSVYEHTVNTHINRLRTKIEKDPAKPEIIQTVWGVGYRFAEQ